VKAREGRFWKAEGGLPPGSPWGADESAGAARSQAEAIPSWSASTATVRGWAAGARPAAGWARSRLASMRATRSASAGLGLDCWKPALLLHCHSAWPGWGFVLWESLGGGRERRPSAQGAEAAWFVRLKPGTVPDIPPEAQRYGRNLRRPALMRIRCLAAQREAGATWRASAALTGPPTAALTGRAASRAPRRWRHMPPPSVRRMGQSKVPEHRGGSLRRPTGARRCAAAAKRKTCSGCSGEAARTTLPAFLPSLSVSHYFLEQCTYVQYSQ
jgi:hypothetical protein